MSFIDTNNEAIIASTVNEDSVADEVHGEKINDNFRHPIDSNSGARGTVIEEDGILYVYV